MTSTGTIDSLSPGQRVGRYIVDSRLARGGMGEVWLATARGPGGFEKRVVVKTVLPSLAEKPGYVDMLVKEASLAARLNHPNVVQVFDLGCVGGLYYIAMEHLSGRS
ncbi:MAG TPA: protein kinase, partial [Kofleriaceae bacterium]|nr:protein kinase [Kofleriaceae bacterium]